MKHLRQIAGKELAAFFSSLTAYIFLGVFLAAVYYIFFWLDPFFARNVADLRPVFEWMPTLMIFLVSALTMRMWSEERRSGTIESLLTSPVSNLELVAGKFLACLLLVLIALALTIPLPCTVALLGSLDWGPVIGGYLACIFLAGAYAAIGLFISSRTDNQIVSLILSTLLCSLLVLLGSDSLTNLFSGPAAEVLKLIGSASRFQSITRGVIDFRDLYYYLSLTGVFLSLNVLTLEDLRWSGNKANARHKVWVVLTALCIANMVAANFWLQQISSARVDLTEGQIYSISPVTRNYLSSLSEPLLIRAYFSKRTHPLLAPLVPRMKDLLREYAIAGKGKVHLEFVDPVENPALEKEAVEKYSISPVTFQTASKYQAAVTASYFDILVKYGDQFETLNFRDLVSAKTQGEGNISVDLKNPEYELTRCIKKVMQSFMTAGNPFAGIDRPVKFVGYISADEKLPARFLEVKNTYKEVLDDLKQKSRGKFTYEFVDPDANRGAIAMQLLTQFGFRPLSRSSHGEPFWFSLVLKDNEKLAGLTLPSDPGKGTIERDLKNVLRRFSKAFIKTVGLYTPSIANAVDATGDYKKEYTSLRKWLSNTHIVMPVVLDGGIVPPQIDLLVVCSPHKLAEKEVFAIDQFLMKGGTVLISSAAYDTSFVQSPITYRKEDSGLEEWLKKQGIEMEDAMVLDTHGFPFVFPSRRVASSTMENTEIVPYALFTDIRKDGMNADGDFSGGLSQVTLTWPSPIKIDAGKNKNHRVMRLLQSSKDSWTSCPGSLVPVFSEQQRYGFPEGEKKGSKLLGVAVEGSFESFFKGKRSPLAEEKNKTENSKTAADRVKASSKKDVTESGNNSGAKSKPDAESASEYEKSKNESGLDLKDASGKNVIEKSPESARIILFSSNNFLSDRLFFLLSIALGTSYENQMQLIDNAIDWSLEDRNMLSIRGRGIFVRTLRMLTPFGVVAFEYGNYVLGVLELTFVWFLRRRYERGVRRRYENLLQAAKPALAEEVHRV